MRAFAATLLLSTLTVPTSALASEPEDSEKPSEQTNKDLQTTQKVEKSKPKKVCRRVQDTGSRSSKRLCLTREQWQEFNNGN